MDIKELNKSQLIMLALLLSFVTSIATGIVTVTLMQQAPSSVTIPINRVVRQTVEKIVPGEVVNTTNTVVVKEEDLVVDAISKNQDSSFSIFKEGLDEEGKSIEFFAGKGLVISKDNIIAMDSSFVSEKGVYYVKNSSGKFKTNFISSNKNGFSFLKITEPLDEKNKLSYTLPLFGDLNTMKIGQKIMILGSSVSSFMFDGSNDLKLNGAKSNAGAPLIDLDGNVLGIALSGEVGSFVSIGTIIESLNSSTEVSI